MPSLPRKRTILAFHRWLGIFSAVFLFILAVTGLLLNHAEPLGLNDLKIRNPLILSRYGMASGSDILSFGIHKTDTISWLDGRLYCNATALAAARKPLGLHENEQGFSIVATSAELVYLTPQGELIERVDASQLPYGHLQFLGMDPSGRPVLVADNGNWQPDTDWLEFTPHDGAFQVVPLVPVEIDAGTRQAILASHQGDGLSLHRILLDLHSGRLFGWGGRTVMDLTAVAIMLLLSSGLAGWLRKSPWRPWGR